MPIWFTQLAGKNAKTAAQSGFWFGLGWFATGISWVHVSIAEFGGMPLIVSLFLMLLLCLYLAIFPAIAAYLSAKLSRTQQVSLGLLVASWVLTEWLRGWVLTGFPWLSVGYSQINSPLSPLAPIIGEVGITLCLFIFGALIVKIISNHERTPYVISFVLLIACTAASYYPNWLTPTGETKQVALVQGNIAQELKWLPEQEWPTMLKYMDMSRKHYQADLIVWPESAIPALEPTVSEFLDMANQAAGINNTAIVTGIINYNFETKQYFNTLVVLGKQLATDTEGAYRYGNANRYNKHHLLPIGEFVPFQEWLRPIAPFFNLPMSSFTRGNYVQENLVANGITIAPLICFEIAFPAQLSANFSAQTDLLLTVSNDAWFGTSHGPHQHMDIARMRALEFGRPLVRSTNTGVTAIVDHHGEFVSVIPQFKDGVATSEITMVSGLTPYSYLQAYPTYLFALLIALLAHIRQRI